jgi:two-component system sensor histidine kinase KdpD
LDQVALAIEGVNLVRDIDLATREANACRLRSTLLTSISHDLRTPLASILGCATSLSSAHAALDGTARAMMVRTIQEEAERLNLFISNLLDVTHLESGPIAMNGNPTDLSDVVGSVLCRSKAILSSHEVQVDLQAGLPKLTIDGILFEQALFNLLDNAAKYSPTMTTIRLRAERSEGQVRLQISDEGDGIPSAELERVFQKFYRVRDARHRRTGTGLGLAICRGFLECMHCTISAENRSDRSGAVFTITLPIPAEHQSNERVA